MSTKSVSVTGLLLRSYISLPVGTRFTIWAKNGSGSQNIYRNMQLIHRCCSVEASSDGIHPRVCIVARNGEIGEGPFVFVWDGTEIDPDRPACNGMPLARMDEVQ